MLHKPRSSNFADFKLQISSLFLSNKKENKRLNCQWAAKLKRAQISMYMKGAAPSPTITLYAKVLKLFKKIYHLIWTPLVFEESFLSNQDKKSTFTVKSESKKGQPPLNTE